MKVLKDLTPAKIKSKLRVKADDGVYLRIEYENGKVCWRPESYDGEDEDEHGQLEEEYQKEINFKGKFC